jgi:hypothetical protein
MAKRNKVDFDFFKTRCEYWIKKLGLIEWFVYIVHEEKDDEQILASASRDITQRKSTITLNSKHAWRPEEVTKNNLNKIALEEALHILLANISYYASQLYDKDLVGEEEHIIINHLIHALCQKEKRNPKEKS